MPKHPLYRTFISTLCYNIFTAPLEIAMRIPIEVDGEKFYIKESSMSNLYWYTSTFAQLHPISRIKIVSNGFFLVEEKVLLPNYQQLIFKKGDQLIQVILYESEILERTYLFVQECEVKEKFIHNLQTKEFTTLCHDMFITNDEPQKMIDQIQASLKEYESESDEDDESEFLHIYGQQMWHDDAFIV